MPDSHEIDEENERTNRRAKPKSETDAIIDLLNRTIHDVNPTKETYDQLNSAYEFFNQRLFGSKLPRCLITMQRKSRAFGFFAKKRFSTRTGNETTDEIALNPRHFRERKTGDILGTLVHEMVHQWQYRFGQPTRGGYHNKEWAEMMKQVGLYPSDTGEPGGKETGPRVSHYVIFGGPFSLACVELVKSGCEIYYVEVGRDEEKRKSKNDSKTKYTCPGCGLNAWAKPAASIVCAQCDALMEP